MAASMFAHLPKPVAKALAAYRRRKRILGALRAVVSVGCVYLLLLLVVGHVDRFSFLDTATRTSFFWAAHGITALVELLQLARFWRGCPSLRQLAYELESKLPTAADERLVTLHALRLEATPQANEIAQALLAQLEAAAVAESQTLRAGRLVTDRPLRRWAGLGCALLSVCLGLSLLPGYQFPLMVERFLFPGQNLPKPSFVRIRIQPERIVVGKGEEVVIQAEIAGEIPTPLAWILKRLGMSPNRCVLAMAPEAPAPFRFGDAAQTDMSRIQRQLFLFSKGDLQEGFRFQVRCGDGQTAVVPARVVAQPRIVDLQIQATPPAYTKLGVETITEPRRALQFLSGTALVVSFRTDQPVVLQELRFDPAPETPPPLAWEEATQTGRCELVLKDELAFEIVVKNQDGFVNVERVKVTLGLREDQPPAVRLDFPAGEMELVAGELIPMRGAIEDDLGLSEVAMRYVLNPTPDQETAPQEAPLEIAAAGLKQVPVAASFDLEKTGAVPGDIVLLRLRARDSAGQDGFSRDIRVRIVPFTRGEGERLRRRALRFLEEALARLAQADPAKDTAPSPDPFAIDKSLYEEIQGLAKKQGVTLAAAPRLESLLELLEKEHHFTDRPRHKTAVRKLYGALLHATLATRAAGPEKALEVRAAALRPLATDVLPGLIVFRQVKNLMWRYFGMRYELNDIRARIETQVAQETPDPGQEEAIKKRAQLYLEALMDLNEELLIPARATDGMDEQTFTSTAGEMNLAAASMRRGSLKRRLRASEDVGAGISAIQTALRPALVSLAERERAAEERLDVLYRAAADVPAPAWLLADARLLSHNPFAGFWLHFANRAAAHRPPADAPAPRPQADGLLAKAAATEQAALDTLAFDWETASVRDLERIGAVEKAMEFLLLRLERLERMGALTDAARKEIADQIAALDLAAASAPLPATTLPEDTLALAQLGSTGSALPGMARQRFPFPEPAACLLPLQTLLGEIEALAARFTQEVEASNTEAAGATLKTLRERLETGETGMAGLLHDLYLHLAYFAPADVPAPALEMLAIQARRILARYQARAAPWLQSLAEEAQKTLDAGRLAALRGTLDSLLGQQRSLKRQIDELAAGFTAGTLTQGDDESRFLVLEEYARTRAYVAAAKELQSAADKKTVAREFLTAFPEAGRLFLASQGRWLQAAIAALRQADAGLTREPADLTAFDRESREAFTALARFRALLADLPDADWKEGLAQPVQELCTRLERLPAAGAALDGTGVSRKRFDVNEIAQGLTQLVARVRALVSL